jgi:hypothetical protein
VKLVVHELKRVYEFHTKKVGDRDCGLIILSIVKTNHSLESRAAQSCWPYFCGTILEKIKCSINCEESSTLEELSVQVQVTWVSSRCSPSTRWLEAIPLLSFTEWKMLEQAIQCQKWSALWHMNPWSIWPYTETRVESLERFVEGCREINQTRLVERWTWFVNTDRFTHNSVDKAVNYAWDETDVNRVTILQIELEKESWWTMYHSWNSPEFMEGRQFRKGIRIEPSLRLGTTDHIPSLLRRTVIIAKQIHWIVVCLQICQWNRRSLLLESHCYVAIYASWNPPRQKVRRFDTLPSKTDCILLMIDDPFSQNQNRWSVNFALLRLRRFSTARIGMFTIGDWSESGSLPRRPVRQGSRNYECCRLDCQWCYCRPAVPQ